MKKKLGDLIEEYHANEYCYASARQQYGEWDLRLEKEYRSYIKDKKRIIKALNKYKV